MGTLAKMQADIILEAAEMAGEIEALKIDRKERKALVKEQEHVIEQFKQENDRLTDYAEQLEKLCRDMYEFNSEKYTQVFTPLEKTKHEAMREHFREKMQDLGLLEGE